ncbi:MAG TPA: hypothetical protein VHY91_14295 [Pirellulales bacterium]|jgi:hypothetical protein|nr:hypothetical protein [Pirellulales bacterium]
MTCRLFCRIALLWLFVPAVGLVASGEEPAAKLLRPDGTPNPAAWMAEGTFGLMTHYLPQPAGATPAERTADLNRLADQFDIQQFVRQFQETGADWLIFTLGQQSGYLCSANPVFDATTPGHTPRRDVAFEVAKRLHAVGKRMILYFPAESDPAVLLGPRDEGYLDRYFEFVRQYSLKFGSLHDGWWFDSCTPHPDDYWHKWLAAARAGNPAAVVAFSGAEFCTGGPINPRCKFEDYHAGEIHLLEDGKIRRDFLYPPEDVVTTADGKLRKRGQEAVYYLPDGPFVDNVQWHGLLPIDLTFNPAVPDRCCHYTDQELLSFIRAVKGVGGALTINVPIDSKNGHIREESHSHLVRLKNHLRP